MRRPRSLVTVLLALGLTAGPVAGFGSTPAAASVPPEVGSLSFGGDISWPNCPLGEGIPERPTLGLPMPLESSEWVIVGLTNGPGFSVNPCMGRQVAWVKQRHMWLGAYAVTTYPTRAQIARYAGSGTVTERLFRTGAAQARANIRRLQLSGNETPRIWVDVEFSSGRPWSPNPAHNVAVVEGAIRTYQAAGLRIGLYSYNYAWGKIMGSKRYPHTPTWVPSGRDSRASALAKCSAPSFSGGPVLIGQWTADGRDYGITCPGVTGQIAAPSPLTPYLDTTVRRGDEGPAVVAVQRRLGVLADGDFGPITEAAVKAYQRAHDYPHHGVVTPNVWRALGAGTSSAARASVFDRLFAST